MRYLITHSLLSSWLYTIKENPYEDMTTERDPMAEFMLALRREPTPMTDAIQNGIDFEDLVTAVVYGRADGTEPWYEAAAKIAGRIRGGVLQYKASKRVVIDGTVFVLHGRLDCLKAGEITDIKFTKSYDPGKFFHSTQHPMYFELVPEANRFTYLVSNGSGVWSETYRRDETKSIIPYIQDFMSWIKTMGLLELYQAKWGAK